MLQIAASLFVGVDPQECQVGLCGVSVAAWRWRAQQVLCVALTATGTPMAGLRRRAVPRRRAHRALDQPGVEAEHPVVGAHRRHEQQEGVVQNGSSAVSVGISSGVASGVQRT